MEIALLGRDMRNADKKRYPIWIDVNWFAINGKVIFKDTKTVCHDQRFIYKRKVTDEELLELDLRWSECSSPVTVEVVKKLEIEQKKAK